MHLFDIKFPVYAIAKNNKRIWEEMNVLYVETDTGIYVLDNKNLSGSTVGERRLKIKNSQLYVPRKVYYNISQFLHSKYTEFLDTTGKYFKWKKSITVPLKYYKVSHVSKYNDDCIVHFKDVECPQKLNCRLAHSIKCIGLLHTEYGYIVYEYSDTYKKDTYRKI